MADSSYRCTLAELIATLSKFNNLDTTVVTSFEMHTEPNGHVAFWEVLDRA